MRGLASIVPNGTLRRMGIGVWFLTKQANSVWSAGQSGEARIFLIQDDNLTAEVPLRRSILQSTLRQKYRSTGRHNPQRDGGPEKGLYRLHPIALVWSACLFMPCKYSRSQCISLAKA